MEAWHIGVIAASALVAAMHGWVLKQWSRAWQQATNASPCDEAGGAGDAGTNMAWSVVIPARNEAPRLGHLLDDLAQQRGDFPVVVVDDHSTDGTSDVARSHDLFLQGRLTVHSNRGKGKKSALMSGLETTSTPWVVTLDADVRLPRSWSQAWQRCLNQLDNQTACVAGPVVLASNPACPGLWEGIQALDYAAQMGWSAGCLAQGRPGSASGANLAVKRATYPDTRHLGVSGDDTLVVQALQREGHRVAWLADARATVSTQGATSVHEWVQQRLRWAQKTVHYAPSAKRTALWMACLSGTQWFLWILALKSRLAEPWMVAWIWWGLITLMHVMYARPVARWFGLKTSWKHAILLGLTQPCHVPALLLSHLGMLRIMGIDSKPIWKGRTCDP